jgi:hypothetical protein
MWLYAVEALKKQIAMPLLNLDFTSSIANQQLKQYISARYFSQEKQASSSVKPHGDFNNGSEMNSRIRVGLLGFREGPKVSIKAPVLRKIRLEELNF